MIINIQSQKSNSSTFSIQWTKTQSLHLNEQPVEKCILCSLNNSTLLYFDFLYLYTVGPPYPWVPQGWIQPTVD